MPDNMKEVSSIDMDKESKHLNKEELIRLLRVVDSTKYFPNCFYPFEAYVDTLSGNGELVGNYLGQDIYYG